MRARVPEPALVLVFAASGASGLVYEVAWTRALRLIVGSTTLSLTIVLAAFMGGLALGAWIAGRRVDRVARPLRVYALLELAIGAYGLALPFLARAVEPLVGSLYRTCEGSPGLLALGELALLAPLVLPGSALMGATLPALGRAVGDATRAGGRLYAANTVGAAAGAAAAGFVLLPTLGLLATTFVAASLNAGLAALVLALERALGSPTTAAGATRREAPDLEAEGHPRTAALAIALAGVAGMSLEIVWTRLFVTSVGSSTYAFTGIVSVYILGLGLGAWLGALLAGTSASASRLLAVAGLGGGFFAALTAPFFAWLPAHVGDLVKDAVLASAQAGEPGGARAGTPSIDLAPILASEVWLVALALLPPTALLGAAFPLAVKLAGGAPDRPGRALARISSSSSLGSIAGALAGGLVLLPLLGLSGALRAASVLAGVAGLVALSADRGGERRLALALGAPLLVAVALAPAPKPELLDSGSYLYGYVHAMKAGESAATSHRREERLVAREEGEDLIAAIYAQGCDESLVINGKVDASSQSDAESQLLVGHLPMLVHGAGVKRALVVGLGSGQTVGAVLAHPGVERVDVIEISPTVARIVRANRVFDHLSRGALRDPRTRLLIADGRTHVRHARDVYDVIVSQPTNPWIAGVGDLFTREQFERTRDRLAPGGVVAQWLQGYSTSPEIFRTIVRTFREVFPRAQLWRFGRGQDFVLLAKAGDPDPAVALGDVQRETARSSALRESLAEAGIEHEAGLLWLFALDAPALEAFAGDGPRNTDDSGWLEFHAPWTLFSSRLPLEGDEARALEARSRWPFPDARAEDVDRVRRALPGYLDACWVVRLLGRVRGPDADVVLLKLADRLLAEVLALRPPAPEVVDTLRAQVLAGLADRGAFADDVSLALAVQEIDRASPRVPWVLNVLLKAAWRVRVVDASERACRRLVALRPFFDPARVHLATVLVARGQNAEALEVLAPVTEEGADALVLRGAALAALGRGAEARPLAERAVALDPSHLRGWVLAGSLRSLAGDAKGAREAFLRATALAPRRGDVWFNYASACQRDGDVRAARDACERALALDPDDGRARALRAQLGDGDGR